VNNPDCGHVWQQLPEEKQWYQACREELDSLAENNTWQVTTMLMGATLIKGRWVFKIKFDVNGKPERFKARWVVRGFRDVHNQTRQLRGHPLPCL
jgi:hypothetical protein